MAKIIGQRQLGSLLSVSVKTANKYIHDDRWPFGVGPWGDSLIPKIVAWRDKYYPSADGPTEATTPATRGDDPLSELRLNPERLVKVKLAIAREAQIQLDMKLKAGNLIEREEVERGRVERIAAVRQELGNIRLLALRLEGLSLPDRERAMEEWARGVCRKFEHGEG